MILPEEEVTRSGFTVQCGRGLYYDVTAFVKLSGHTGLTTISYPNLTWTEAMDVVLATLEGWRPGFRVGRTHTQRTLDEFDD